MPNENNIRKVIEAVRAERFDFDIREWSSTAHFDEVIAHPCGTTLCIGGHAEVLMLEERDEQHAQEYFLTTQSEHGVERWLGLSHGEASDLFYNFHHGPLDITRETAIAALESIIADGEWRGWQKWSPADA